MVLQGEAFSTIHITPEEACCYTSVELTGCADLDPAAFIAKVSQPTLYKKSCVEITHLCVMSHLASESLGMQQASYQPGSNAMCESLDGIGPEACALC